jgi:hypothetical protein
MEVFPFLTNNIYVKKSIKTKKWLLPKEYRAKAIFQVIIFSLEFHTFIALTLQG